jgi:hypothetical protein
MPKLSVNLVKEKAQTAASNKRDVDCSIAKFTGMMQSGKQLFTPGPPVSVYRLIYKGIARFSASTDQAGRVPGLRLVTSEEAHIGRAPLSLNAPDGGCTTTEFERYPVFSESIAQFRVNQQTNPRVNVIKSKSKFQFKSPCAPRDHLFPLLGSIESCLRESLSETH